MTSPFSRGAIVLLAASCIAAASAPGAEPRFVTDANPFLIGQAPDWLDDRTVVWHDPVVRDEDGDGQTQVHRSRLDGSDRVCLTCGLDGPNQVALAQPHGRWNLFHSWIGRGVTIGGPGFGGLGSDVWVMSDDGTLHTNLTLGAELEDHFHASWSPDGRWIVWTALDWNPEGGGDGRSEIRLARFDPRGPRLVDVRVVRPQNGHWYETQWWAPDGSGFLYTETADQAVNPELYFCRLPDPAAGRCRPVRLTVDPAWDEQAIFTADMKRVLFMSSRDLPGAHNTWSTVAKLLDLPADFDHLLILPVFADSFLQPRLQQATDLYEITLRWNRARTRFKPGPVRRLTRTGEDGWVIPEFSWDPRGRRLLWTQNRYAASHRLDQGCVVRALRDAALGQLRGVRTLDQVPVGLPVELRERAAELLRDPKSFALAAGCGGGAPGPTAWEQQTRIGRFTD